MFEIRYGIAAVRPGTINPDPSEVLHFIGYEEPPGEVDFQEAREEMETDVELGFVGEMDDIELVVASEEIVEYFRDEVGPLED